ncbi:hypothetical protein N9V06_00630 [SAR86 cluster bacterium]|nr:hypothetical protein [SAR86 cluster bacterium]
MIKFIDLDGVIIDSIHECFSISLQAFYGKKNFKKYEETKNLFFEYRGLVNPAKEYLVLMQSIDNFRKKINQKVSFRDEFKFLNNKISKEDKLKFEKKFFSLRKEYQKNDIKAWMELNPLTDFGKTLVNKKLENHFIITAKNYDASKIILDFYKIKVSKIFAKDDIEEYGNKGTLISSILDKYGKNKAIFIDDHTDNLDFVCDSRVNCYFANWGYGTNSSYPIYKYS